MAQLILYACPTGPLAEQIETYFKYARQQCGDNAAHAYMPHCTLTGFFEDEESALPTYIKAMEKVIATHQPHISKNQRSKPSVLIQSLSFRPDWHGLVLQADWLKHRVRNFAEQANSPTRTEAIRVKDWLHLSLAYGFRAEHATQLEKLAVETVNISAPVEWEARFYRRHDDNTWTCYSTILL
ncbi:MAG: hypothetical protein AAF703_11305 [Cyanobacteria bacterium P01_D01_bin.105]